MAYRSGSSSRECTSSTGGPSPAGVAQPQPHPPGRDLDDAPLDHVQAGPTGRRGLLQARTGPLADIAAAVEGRSRRRTLHHLGADDPSPVLAAALDSSSALERQLGLDRLDRPSLSRPAVEDLLLSSFLEVLRAAARHDEQAQRSLTPPAARARPGPGSARSRGTGGATSGGSITATGNRAGVVALAEPGLPAEVEAAAALD